MNDQLAQFLPRDDGTSHEKLANDEIMDIIKAAMPKSWQEEMQNQRFNFAAEGQVKFISFCENLETLDPPKETKGKSDNADASSTFKAANGHISKRKRSDNENFKVLSIK
eukprot:3448382-Ditylum_brightwellii.AAC.1